MEQDLIFLAIAFFSASMLQAATGIGFGIIAGPVLLLVLNSPAAIQISVLQSWLICAVLVPGLRSSIQTDLIKVFGKGSAIGIPLGGIVYFLVSIGLLKFLAGLAVLGTLFFVLHSSGSGKRRQAAAQAGPPPVSGAWPLSMGLVSGAMNSALAMPGPVPAAWMSGAGHAKDVVRATTLALLLFTYPAAFILQWFLVGLTAETLWLCAGLAPATLAGIMVGRLLVRRVTEVVFRWFLVLVLISTVAGLFYDSLKPLVTS